MGTINIESEDDEKTYLTFEANAGELEALAKQGVIYLLLKDACGLNDDEIADILIKK